MSTPQNEFDGAQRILKKYYRALVKRMAEEIIEHSEDFETPLFPCSTSTAAGSLMLRVRQRNNASSSSDNSADRRHNRMCLCRCGVQAFWPGTYLRGP